MKAEADPETKNIKNRKRTVGRSSSAQSGSRHGKKSISEKISLLTDQDIYLFNEGKCPDRENRRIQSVRWAETARFVALSWPGNQQTDRPRAPGLQFPLGPAVT